MPIYHGSPNNFKKFAQPTSAGRTPRDRELGIFFCECYEDAKDFSVERAEEGAYSTYVYHAEVPSNSTWKIWDSHDGTKIGINGLDCIDATEGGAAALRLQLMANGYVGVLIGHTPLKRTVVVFDADSINIVRKERINIKNNFYLRIVRLIGSLFKQTPGNIKH